MNKLARSFFLVLLLFIAVSLFFSLLETSSLNITEVSFSEIIETLRQEEVQKIEISPDRVKVFLPDDKILFSKREPNVSFSEVLKNFGFSPEEISSFNIEIKGDSLSTVFFSIILPIFLPIILLIFLVFYSFRRANQGAMQIFSFSRSNIKLFMPSKDRITFKNVAGLKEAKEELKEVVEFLKTPKKFQEIGAKIPRGVLLMGPPGSGKTLLARAVAGEAKVPFFHISGSEFVEMFVGVGASRVRDTFTTAKKAAPSILFIDEIDAIGRVRGAGLGGGHDEREQTLNQILVEMDGFDRDTQTIVIAATNRPDVLDPALLRPGRFDRRVVLDLPSIDDREEILKIHVQDKSLGQDVNLREIAERTPGFSGADLANLTNEAAILAARRNQKNITQKELIDSIEKVILGPERKSRVLTKKEKEITAFHEAGHALVSVLLPSTSSSVRKISIITRGRAAGYTIRMPSEEKYMKTSSEFLADLCVLLGGYVAEEIKFRDVTTGGSNDLKEATNIARGLVTKYGMSKKIGPISFGDTEELVFLGREITTEKGYSEETAAKIDKEVADILKKCYNRTKKLLNQNKNKLELVARELMKKETLEKEEFEKLVR